MTVIKLQRPPGPGESYSACRLQSMNSGVEAAS